MFRRTRWLVSVVTIIGVMGVNLQAQVYNIDDFDETAEGPWSDIVNTTITAPMVADGSITLDGNVSGSEYGGFQARNVLPGSADGTIGNAWILGFAQSKGWDGANDSSFSFWVAHDTEFLYIGVDVKDDTVRSNDPNPQFWKDDAIEIIIDANNDRANVNTDQSAEFFNDYGGHSYVNYEGRFSRWDEAAEEPIIGWANAVDWTYAENGQVWGVGGETPTGWSMEAKFHKSQFEDPNGGGAIEIGDRIGFNIGMDDDDGADLEIQYWWANRARPIDFDAFALDAGDTIDDYPPDVWPWEIDANGRLTHGATGELIFGGPSGPLGDFNMSGDLDAGDIDELSRAVREMSVDMKYDLTGDAKVDDADREFWITDSSVAHTWVGDANLDGAFSSQDFVVVFLEGKYETNETAGWGQGDWNGDGVFSSQDFVASFLDGGYEAGPRPAVAAVPEPSSMVLLLLGTAVCWRRIRKTAEPVGAR